MTKPTTTLLEILEFHRGRHAAISADDLLLRMKRYGCDVPNISALRDLIHDARQDGHLIASCDAGYFLPVEVDEGAEYIDKKLLGPGADLLRTARIQRRALRRQFPAPQLRLMP